MGTKEPNPYKGQSKPTSSGTTARGQAIARLGGRLMTAVHLLKKRLAEDGHNVESCDCEYCKFINETLPK